MRNAGSRVVGTAFRLLVVLGAGLMAPERRIEAQTDGSVGPASADTDALREAVASFLAAASEQERSVAVREITTLRPDVTLVAALLQEGREYANDVGTGLRRSRWISPEETEFPYMLWVPTSYDATRSYPVRVYLHGGVARGPWSAAESWWKDTERLQSEDHIALFPASWTTARWWQRSQVESLRAILLEVRRLYNVDQNRVSLTGVSDGGTGAYFFAFRDTTPWASFLPFIAHPAVLLNPGVGADGAMYLGNLVNKPLFVVNGTDDRLYPTRAVEPFIAEFLEAGVDVVYRPQEGGGHDTRWWPAEAARIDAFTADHPREPHPTRLSWEVEDGSPYTRAHWVTIDELGPTEGDRRFEPSLLLDPGLFAGRVDVSRDGNVIEVASANVRRFTLLLSDQAFDLDEPIRVVWNGRVTYDGRVRRSLATLLDWAAHDDDRTMLYQASLTIDWRTR